MPAYRLYQIDGGGRFSTAEWIEADDDDAALNAARAISRSGACEIWQLGRLVARIEGGGAAQEEA